MVWTSSRDMGFPEHSLQRHKGMLNSGHNLVRGPPGPGRRSSIVVFFVASRAKGTGRVVALHSSLVPLWAVTERAWCNQALFVPTVYCQEDMCTSRSSWPRHRNDNHLFGFVFSPHDHGTRNVDNLYCQKLQ